jgi:hypothetical protein
VPGVRVRRWWGAALVAVAVTGAPPGVAEAADAPDGLVAGRPHILRLRPELRALPRAPRDLTRRARAAGAAAVASCDPARVQAAGPVPTTSRTDDAAAACVVLPVDSASGSAPRVLLGPAHLTGLDVQDVRVQRRRGRDQVVVRLIATAPDAAPIGARVDVDGRVVGTLESPRAEMLVISGPTIDDATADAIALAVDQARSEQLITLADEASMTRRARKLLAEASARVVDKAEFVSDCPSPEASSTLVLGCYDGRIFVLRVDRPDLAPVMTVTAAHEVLHAAFERLSPDRRRRVVGQLDAFMTSSSQPRIEALLADYDVLQPGTRDNELHSLVGTQVGDLPPPLERYYRRYFTDRSAIVAAFDSYQKVFDDLKASYDALESEVKALERELSGLQADVASAGDEADRLAREIDELRAEGRIDESNQLVEAQNAAAARANDLIATFNARVDAYNARIEELNALAISLNESYDEISPIPVDPSG